jgi:hypothetical protein
MALVGPLILVRSGATEGSLGELVWMTGGLIIWLFDLAGALQGQGRIANWATPLGDRSMGLAMMAVLLAGWRCGLASRSWTWTNVVGWALGIFWVGLALGSWFLKSPLGSPALAWR